MMPSPFPPPQVRPFPVRERGRRLAVPLAALLALAAALPLAAQRDEPPPADPRAIAAAEAAAAGWQATVDWPEPQRAFLHDGPGWLLTEDERAELLAMDAPVRQAWIDGFLSDAGFAAAVAARRALMLSAVPSPTDVRGRLLFLHGPPTERLEVDCGLTFRPLEIWTWGAPDAPQRAGSASSVLVYEDETSGAWRLWLPQQGKRVLYTRAMEGWLEDWEELRGRGMRARRFDLQACRDTRAVDRATGVRGLADADQDRPRAEDILAWLAPPADLGAWARAAAATTVEAPPPLELGALAVRFPSREGQRMSTRFVVELPPGAAEPAIREGRLAAAAGEAWNAAFPGERAAAADAAAGEGAAADAPAAEAAGEGAAQDAAGPPAEAAAASAAPPDPAAEREVRLVVEGIVERDAAVLDRFRVRFRPDAPEEGRPLALVVDRSLRPEAEYLVRLAVRDEVSGRVGHVAGAFRVPAEPRPEDAAPAAEDVVVAIAEDLGRRPIAGVDHLLLVPPEQTVVLGLWRAEALVSGSRIDRVAFLVDGEVQLSRSRPPFTAELRLDRFPREQVIAAVGYDAAGEVVAADEVVVNQPRGQLRVRILEPARGVRPTGRTPVRAEVTVPDGRRVERVELQVNEVPVATLERPPWEAEVEVPAGEEVVYLTAVAWLDDGSRAEDVRVLAAPGFVEQVDVALIELYVAAVDRQNRPVPGLAAADFRVLEEGRPQEVRRFEEVRDLPLAVGVVLDTSGSMESSLAEAQAAANEFLRRVVGPGDAAFAVAFADVPQLLAAPTDDVDAVADALAGLRANGYTVLHDALVTALYYFRGLEGQKALVLLSDGDDTASGVPWKDALEYARRMNAAVYTIGLGVGSLDLSIRRKLEELAQSTGGRSFFIRQAAELDAVYDEIEAELRSRYLLAFSSERPRDPAAPDGDFRRVEVEVSRPGVTGRTIRGYYP
jgi:Ca-activated chloride channel homolog